MAHVQPMFNPLKGARHGYAQRWLSASKVLALLGSALGFTELALIPRDLVGGSVWEGTLQEAYCPFGGQWNSCPNPTGPPFLQCSGSPPIQRFICLYSFSLLHISRQQMRGVCIAPMANHPTAHSTDQAC